jgi:hypothetical protein
MKAIGDGFSGLYFYLFKTNNERYPIRNCEITCNLVNDEGVGAVLPTVQYRRWG